VNDSSQSVRLQKVLSQAGVASRRAAEKLIADGRVSVNGKTILTMGVKVEPGKDEIRVDGRRIKGASRLRYILLYKPTGYVTTRSDPQRRRTVLDLLAGVREYVYPVGRLDYDTEGLLLLTNDGDLAARLTHPRHGVARTYEARVAGMPDREAIDRLRAGIPLDGHRTLPAEVVLLNDGRRDRDGVLRITIREGRNRQVRRMCEAVGHPVQHLKRTKFGSLADRRLKPGEWRELGPDEVAALKVQSSKVKVGK
jgi:23S rRNA pseudouridine2605 synthase